MKKNCIVLILMLLIMEFLGTKAMNTVAKAESFTTHLYTKENIDKLCDDYCFYETTSTEPVYSNVTYYRYRDRIK